MLNRTQAFNLLTAVNFNIETAYNAFVAIDGTNRRETAEILHDVATKAEYLKSIIDTLKNGGKEKYRLDLRSVNDGNNIYDEYFNMYIKDGDVVLKFFNSSYVQQGIEITKENAEEYQDRITQTLKKELSTDLPMGTNFYLKVLLAWAKTLDKV